MDKRLFLLSLGAFATSTVAFVFAGLLPLISEDLGVTVAQAGYLLSAFSLSYAIGTPVLSALAGSMDRRRVIALALIFFSAGNLAAALSGNASTLLAAQIVMGMAAGLFAATAQATAISLAGPERRAAAIAVVVGGTTFAVAFGAPGGSLLAHLVGWRGAFAALALVGAFCLAALSLRLPRNLTASPSTLGERLIVVRRPGVLPAIFVTFLYLSGAFVVISYLGPVAIDGAGLGREILPAILLAFGIGAIAGNYTSGRLADRLGATRVVVFSMIGATAFSVGFALITEFVPDAMAGPLMLALMVPWGFVGWAFTPAQASRLVGAAPEVAHLTLALNVSAIYFGIGFGTFVGGRVLELGDASDLGLVGAGLVIAALVVLALSRQRAGRTAVVRA